MNIFQHAFSPDSIERAMALMSPADDADERRKRMDERSDPMAGIAGIKSLFDIIRRPRQPMGQATQDVYGPGLMNMFGG